MAESGTFQKMLAERYAAREQAPASRPPAISPQEISHAGASAYQQRLQEIEALAAVRGGRIAEFVAACAEVVDALNSKGATPELVLRGTTDRKGFLGIPRKDSRIFAMGWTLTDQAVIGRPTVHTQEEEPRGLERSLNRYYRDVTIPGIPSRRWGVILDTDEGLAIRYDGGSGVVKGQSQPDGTFQRTVEILNPTIEVLDHQTSVDTVPLMERLADLAFAHEVLQG